MEPPPIDEDIDALVHLAAVIDVEDPPRKSELATNVGGSWILAAWSRRNQVRHLHGSTGGVYGCGPEPFKETHPLAPVDAYSTTKAMGEIAVAATNPEASIVRYFFPYGPGTPNPIPTLLSGLREGVPIRARSDGGPRFNPLHVDDAVELTFRLLETDFSGPINLAGEEVLSFAELAAIGSELLETATTWTAVESGDLHPYYRSDVVGDISRAQRELGPIKYRSLADGLSALIEHLS